jgi:hypothetical protein
MVTRIQRAVKLLPPIVPAAGMIRGLPGLCGEPRVRDEYSHYGVAASVLALTITASSVHKNNNTDAVITASTYTDSGVRSRNGRLFPTHRRRLSAL